VVVVVMAYREKGLLASEEKKFLEGGEGGAN
jgi:hypothetical protein